MTNRRSNRQPAVTITAIALALSILTAAHAQNATTPTLVTFDGIATGTLPQGWRIAATNPEGKPAEWTVAADTDAPSSPNILTITKIHDTSNGVYNLCWTPAIPFRDGEIVVRVRAEKGEEDQGGGPIWRARDANNYYIARYNPLERNFRIYFVKDGSRKAIGDAKAEIPAGEWFTIRIVHAGKKIDAYLNDKHLVTVVDETFATSGGVGLWTKADAMTSFDDLSIRRQ